MPDTFFEQARDQSKVKIAIVEKYFWAWARIMSRQVRNAGRRIAYLDLFAGPGYYKDGTKSTPILLLERAVQDPDLRQMLVAIFSDADPKHAQALQAAVCALEGRDGFRYPPQVLNREVDGQLAAELSKIRLDPTLLFADPWGFKGLSLELIEAVLKDWGCDCILFFNYNRINMGLGNEYVREHLDVLFGGDRAEALRERLARLPDEPERPRIRELMVIEEIAQALRSIGGSYVLPFRFKDERGARTSHHLIFVSKHPLGYKIMKEIMRDQSSSAPQGVATFEYNPADERCPLLFEYARPLDDLEEMLLDEFAERELTMEEVFEAHNVGRPFVARNYKDALLRLEAAGKIVASPPVAQRRVNTFADRVVVTFPKR